MLQSNEKQFDIVTALLKFAGMWTLTTAFIFSLFTIIPVENFEQDVQTAEGMLNHIIKYAPFNFWFGIVAAGGLSFVTIYFFARPVIAYVMGYYDEPQTEAS